MRLEQLIAELAATTPSAERLHPEAASETTLPTSAWLAETARLRRVANARALAHRYRVDEACERLFGTTAASLLPRLGVALRRYGAEVQARQVSSLRSLVPDLPEGAPQGAEADSYCFAPGSIRVFVTTPRAPEAVIVRLHGGAFWMGGGSLLGRVDRFLVDHIAERANAIVVEVDYRLAPEHQYPAPVIDALTVLDALREGQLGVPKGSIGLLGTSSGANILALTARLEAIRGNEIAALGLVVPSLNLVSGPLANDMTSSAWLRRRALLRCYLGDVDLADPWVSAGTAARLPGMPPTFAALAKFDEVAAGGEGFCAAIRADGQRAEARNYPMTHVVATPDIEAAYITDLGEFFNAELKRATRRSTVGVCASRR